MGVALGVTAGLLGVIFMIVGWHGGGPNAMNGNLIEMVEGRYPTWNGGTPVTPSLNPPVSSTTGGANKSQPNPPRNGQNV